MAASIAVRLVSESEGAAVIQSAGGPFSQAAHGVWKRYSTNGALPTNASRTFF